LLVACLQQPASSAHVDLAPPPTSSSLAQQATQVAAPVGTPVAALGVPPPVSPSESPCPSVLPTAADSAARARLRWWEPPESGVLPMATLTALQRDGLRWLGRRARVVVQFNRSLDQWDPWISRFHPGPWLRLSAWGDEQFLWQHDVWQQPWSELYVRRDGPAAAVLAGATLTRRYELEIDVREHLYGSARIEVLSATPLLESVGEGAVLHASRAMTLLEDGNRHFAKAEFERALAGLLPAHARVELERLIQGCAADGESAAATRTLGRAAHGE
jgi:hypothetical protein